jgi:Protein of unknown function (DUF3562)
LPLDHFIERLCCCANERERTYNRPIRATRFFNLRSPPAFVAAIKHNLKLGATRCSTKDQNQDAVNLDAIASLAEETHQPYEVVKDVYEKQFARLSADARVTDYLILFASRRTRDILANRRA